MGQKAPGEKRMKRDRLEYVWYAVRPLLYYLILFITIREVLARLLETVLLRRAYDMAYYSAYLEGTAQTVIVGIATAGALVPVLREGRREIMILGARSDSAWITKRRDSCRLMAMLPLGTICLCALLNLLLAAGTDPGTQSLPAVGIPAGLPLSAAVYGILTPFAEELVYRGIVYHRMRRICRPMAAAFFSSLLFGAAHADLRQGVYAFIMGMVFALSLALTRRFEVPFLLHSTCNLAVLAASFAGWGQVLAAPMWILFFAVTATAVFVYWGVRALRTGFQF